MGKRRTIARLKAKIKKLKRRLRWAEFAARNGNGEPMYVIRSGRHPD